MGPGDQEGDTATGPNGEKAFFHQGQWKMLRPTASSGAALDADTTQYLAQKFENTGQMPALGMGSGSARLAIAKTAAANEKKAGRDGFDATARNAEVHAAIGALGVTSKQRAAVEGSEQAALNSGKLALQLAGKGAGPTGAPILNKWIQSGRRNVVGDTDVTNFNQAVGTFADEYARVIAGGTGNKELTDSARHEAYSRLDKAFSVAQLQGIYTQMQKEMTIKSSSIRAQEARLHNQIKDFPGQPQQVAPQPVSAAPTKARPSLDQIFGH